MNKFILNNFDNKINNVLADYFPDENNNNNKNENNENKENNENENNKEIEENKNKKK